MVMGVRRNFSRGSNVGILLFILKLLTMQCKLTFTNRLPFLNHKANNNHKKCASLAAIARYVTIVHIAGYLQIFNAGYFFTSKHCHGLQRSKLASWK